MRRARAGRRLRHAHAAPLARLHAGRRADARDRHRREHRDLQRRARHSPAAAAVRRSLAARDGRDRPYDGQPRRRLARERRGLSRRRIIPSPRWRCSTGTRRACSPAPAIPSSCGGFDVGGDFFSHSRRGRRSTGSAVFAPEDTAWKGTKSVLVNETLWRTRFGSDPKLVGSMLTLDNERYRVIGIVPAQLGVADARRCSGFRSPTIRRELREESRRRYLKTLARLKPGVTIAARDRRHEGDRRAPRCNNIRTRMRSWVRTSCRCTNYHRQAAPPAARAARRRGLRAPDRVRERREPAARARRRARGRARRSHRARRRTRPARSAARDREHGAVAGGRRARLAARDRWGRSAHRVRRRRAFRGSTRSASMAPCWPSRSRSPSSRARCSGWCPRGRCSTPDISSTLARKRAAVGQRAGQAPRATRARGGGGRALGDAARRGRAAHSQLHAADECRSGLSNRPLDVVRARASRREVPEARAVRSPSSTR